MSVIILALGAIQLVSAFHTYALNLAELNGLRRQEAALVAKKQSLENEISRWDDKAYVTAQARERLGFVFPGEVSVHVKNSQAVTGEDSDAQSLDEDESAVSTASVPWYSELAYGIRKADEPSKKATKTAVDSGTGTTGTDASTPSGSSTAKRRARRFTWPATQSATSWFVLAPARRASSVTSSGLRSNCG